MAKPHRKPDKQMVGLMDHLTIQRESILNKWRSVCAQGMVIVSKTSFSREEFNDQTPVILSILNQRLAKLPQESDVVSVAQAHGLHRWQRGYSLPELLVELEHLFRIVVETISDYHQNTKKLSGEQLKPLTQVSSSHQTGGKSDYPLDHVPTTEAIKQNSNETKESEGLGLFIVKNFANF